MLTDSFGRQFEYLRVSITDVCNYRCQYCLPNGYLKPTSKPQREFLSKEEIANAVASFAALGTRKIRITGGEPAIRSDLTEIIQRCKQVSGIETVAITTNGYRLENNIRAWHQAGLDRLNVSIDSFDPRLFHSITGHNHLESILRGVEQALELGLEKVKVNSVLLRQFNAQGLEQILHWLKDRPVTLRFIELMQTGDNLRFFEQQHVSGQALEFDLLKRGWQPIARGSTAGPAKEFQHPNYRGRVGLIMPYEKGFCETCNRLRLSAKGDLQLCLFGEQGLNIRNELTNQNHQILAKRIVEYVKTKQAAHSLKQGNSGVTRHLAMIGG